MCLLQQLSSAGDVGFAHPVVLHNPSVVFPRLTLTVNTYFPRLTLTANALPSYRCSALLSWYKYLLRNAYTTAGRALLGSRDGLLDWLLLTPQRNVLFLVLVTACSFCYSSNHSHLDGVLWSNLRSALSSWYKYLLFRNAYNTAGCALLGSRNDLLILLQQQRWTSLLLSTLSTFVLVQVPSLQTYLHHSGTCSSRIS